MRRHQLTVVLVGRHHVRLDALRLGLCCQRADDIVGLVARHLQYGNPVRLQQLLDDGHAEADSLRRLLALRFIGWVGLVAEGAAVGVEGHADVRGLLLRQHLVQRVDEAVDGRDILALAVDARVLDKTIVAPIDEGVGVE